MMYIALPLFRSGPLVAPICDRLLRMAVVAPSWPTPVAKGRDPPRGLEFPLRMALANDAHRLAREGANPQLTCESADAKEGNNDARQHVESPRPARSSTSFEYINAEPCGGFVELVCM